MEYKAKFIKRIKGGFNYATHKKDNDILVYRCRGREYEIEDIPFYQQEAFYWKNSHHAEQSRIDSIIEEEERNKNQEYDYKKTADFALEQLCAYCEGESSIYDEE